MLALHLDLSPWYPLSTPWYDHSPLSISMVSVGWVFVFTCRHHGFPSKVVSGVCLVTPTGTIDILLTDFHSVQLICLVLLSCGAVCANCSTMEVKWFAQADSLLTPGSETQDVIMLFSMYSELCSCSQAWQPQLWQLSPFSECQDVCMLLM